MKIIIPVVILDLIGDFSGDNKRKLCFTWLRMTPYIWVVNRIRSQQSLPFSQPQDRWELETRWRLQKSSWVGRELPAITRNGCQMGGGWEQTFGHLPLKSPWFYISLAPPDFLANSWLLTMAGSYAIGASRKNTRDARLGRTLTREHRGARVIIFRILGLTFWTDLVGPHLWVCQTKDDAHLHFDWRPGRARGRYKILSPDEGKQGPLGRVDWSDIWGPQGPIDKLPAIVHNHQFARKSGGGKLM